MKNLKFKIAVASVVVSMGMLTGCYEKFDNPAPETPVVLTINMTLAEFNTLPPRTTIEGDVIIGGRVISTDRYGNIYKSLYIEDGTGGLEIKIGKTTLYNTYQLGDTVYVKAKHLVSGPYSIGAPSTNSSYDNSHIDAQLWINMTIFKGRYGGLVTPKIINNFGEINSNSYCTLVTLKNMTYAPTDTLRTWALSGLTTPGGNAQNQTFTFPASSEKIVVRTSNYAKFASKPVPAVGSTVNLTGILTIFGTTKQFVLNSLDGVEIVTTP